VTGRELLAELKRLRADNARLRERVNELQGTVHAEALQADIAMLSQADRFRVRQFIAAVIREKVRPPLMEP
jgi:hypothetical protein